MDGELDAGAVEVLRDRTRGDVLEPGDPGYDGARSVWNARIDRAPAVVVRCTGAADVVAGVDVARDCDLPVSVKGGGHHVSGSAVVEDGVVLDCSPMDAVRVDPRTKTARVQAGATWGDVDHETQAFGLAVPGGQDPDIGVAGLTLGGGVGWLSRKYGLTCDNLLSADVVTADGEVVRASEDRNGDLFWALRGGGGNFGVATEFEFQLHEVGPEIFAGSLVYPFDDARALGRRYRSFATDAPPEVRLLYGSMVLPATDYYPVDARETRVAMIIACYAGPPEEGERVLAPFREFGEPFQDSIRPRSYAAWQRAGNSRGAMRTYLKSQYLAHLSDAAVDTVVEHAAAAPSSGATVFISPRGGAETDPASNATAYPHRDAAHHLLVEARWEDPDRDDDHVAWTRAFHDAMRPYATGDVAMNFLTRDESDRRIGAAYGENYDRLVAVKDAWDPENRFGGSHHLDPSG
jgi:FAD/FMN-containing dehydrogenase